MTETAQKLANAAEEANEITLAMFRAMLHPESTDATVAQAKAFQPVFSAIQDVLADAHRNYWAPGQAPDDWESFDSSQAVMELADAILAIRGGAA